MPPRMGPWPSTVLKASLLLPKTNFPMRAQAVTRELPQVERLTTDLYRRQLAERQSTAEWILHDGPPYANGSLHMGHFLNKVLKDMINRRALVGGKRVAFTPGWDCHGLPIELKVLSEVREKSKGQQTKALSPIEIRRLAAASATEAIAGQAADFKRWGVLADWEGVDAWVRGARSATATAAVSAGGPAAHAAPPLPSPAPSSLPGAPPPLYVTMTPSYEAAQLRAWRDIVARGTVQRALKPVHWSPSSKTALAEAELEYADDHVSASVFVGFPLASAAWATDPAVRAALEPLSSTIVSGGNRRPGRPVLEAAVWTTTPWTLPANVALAVSGALEYSMVAAGGRVLLAASERLGELQRVLSAAQGGAPLTVEVLHVFPGEKLQGLLFAHPLAGAESALPPIDGELRLDLAKGTVAAVSAGGNSQATGAVRVSPVILGDNVTSDSGTGIVHTAPGHGAEDFAACADAREGLAALLGRGGVASSVPARSLLPVLCPVDDDGRFTSAVGPSLSGQHVLKDGTQSVLGLLTSAGSLLLHEPFRHRYPYDWRTKQPVIVRATQQWFVTLDNGEDGGAGDSVIQRASAALRGVAFTPAGGRARLTATLGTRREWCVSRQRSWGVPVPVLYVTATSPTASGDAAHVTIEGVVYRRGDAYMTPASVEHIAGVVGAHGADAWWTRPVEDFLPPGVAAVAAAAGLGFVRGSDTLDVWFDSGVSWAASWGGYRRSARGAEKEGEGAALPHGLGGPSDMVLEGSDQHRGWFQSSLLTAVAAQGGPGAPRAPYAAVLTHGFVLDEKLRKMSKSLGNVIAPRDIIEGKPGGAGKGGAPAKGGKKAGAAPGGKEPEPIGLGVDVLRLWAASADYSNDCVIGPSVMATVAEAGRKLRNTARYMLASLQGFTPRSLGPQPARHAEEDMLAAWSAPVSPALLSASSLPLLDALLLHRLGAFQREVEAGYDALSFQRVAAALANVTSVELSTVYFDAVKDTLYCDAPVTGLEAAAQGSFALPRRAIAQLVMWEALRCVTRAMAPVLPFTSEDVFQHSAEFVLPQPVQAQEGSGDVRVPGVTVFDARIPLLPDGAFDSVQLPSCGAVPSPAAWAALLWLRGEVNKCLEAARQGRDIGASTEAAVFVTMPVPSSATGTRAGVAYGVLRRLLEDGSAPDVLLASQVTLVETRELHCETAPGNGIARSVDADGGWAYRFYTQVPHLEGLDRVNSGNGASSVGLSIGVRAAQGGRCARCRRYALGVTPAADASETSAANGEMVGPDRTCGRCRGVLSGTAV